MLGNTCRNLIVVLGLAAGCAGSPALAFGPASATPPAAVLAAPAQYRPFHDRHDAYDDDGYGSRWDSRSRKERLKDYAREQKEMQKEMWRNEKEHQKKLIKRQRGY